MSVSGVSVWIARLNEAGERKVESAVRIALPVLIESEIPPVEGLLGRRVPPYILETASTTPAPWAPGVVLMRSDLDGSWEAWRAYIEDVATGDVRSYAIGDLLPYGSLLVGISTAAADILVADVELVRLFEGGRLRSLVDFRAAYEIRPLDRVRDTSEEYRRLVDEWLERLLLDDPASVQEAIDVLVESGEPAIEQLMAHVGSAILVVPGPYDFGDPRAGAEVVQTQGDIVMRILRAITGQAFVDARQWKRWWSGR